MIISVLQTFASMGVSVRDIKKRQENGQNQESYELKWDTTGKGC